MSDQEYNEDFGSVQPGDRVTLEHASGDTATVVATSLQFDGFDSTGGKLWRPNTGWTVTVIEKAKPPLDAATAEWILREVEKRSEAHPFGSLSCMSYLRETVAEVIS